jgi:hypothetical protein
MSDVVSNREPVDPVDEELRMLLQHPAVRERLNDFERRRDAGLLGDGISHSQIRELLGLPPVADSELDP